MSKPIKFALIGASGFLALAILFVAVVAFATSQSGCTTRDTKVADTTVGAPVVTTPLFSKYSIERCQLEKGAGEGIDVKVTVRGPTAELVVVLVNPEGKVTQVRPFELSQDRNYIYMTLSSWTKPQFGTWTIKIRELRDETRFVSEAQVTVPTATMVAKN